MKRIHPHTKGALAPEEKDARYGVGVYLDYAASTPVDPAVSAAMRPYFSKIFGNPSSLHQFGQEASAAVFKARLSIAKSLGADYREIIFTGSATEANNLVLRGVAIAELRRLNAESSTSVLAQKNTDKTQNDAENFCDRPRKVCEGLRPRIITSAVEHESVLETCRDLEKDGAEVVYVPVSKDGIVDLKELANALNERTILVSIMHANNEIGTIQPIFEIHKIIKDFKNRQVQSSKFKVLSFYPLFHTDAVQSFQYLDCDVDKLGVDLMALSAHKIYGPKGIGALYIRGQKTKDRGQPSSFHFPLSAIITGSGQEFGLRSGTDNVPYIVGFGKAVEIIDQLKNAEVKRVGKLRDYFYKSLKKILPKIEINGSLTRRLPNNLNIYFPEIKSQELLIKLDLAGIAASLGAACFSRTAQPSYVLRAMGFSLERALGSLRFSLGRQTTKKDIDYTLRVIANLIREYGKYSE